MMEWKFDKITPQTTKVDPAHLEFFRSEALEDPVSALVREDIQNRLDAKRDRSSAPVKVRYFLSGDMHPLDACYSEKWLRGLDEHLNAHRCLEEIGSDPIDLKMPMSYLVIEDFNTTGLRGDPLETADPGEKSGRNDFYWFIRNVGRTGKKAGDRGRWGLGKIVYPASSLIRSFFCYSVREGDCRRALIGRSVLAIHAVNGSEYQSEGYYALFPDTQYPYFAVAEEDESVINEFVTRFHLRRTPDEPGLSLVIPFRDETITFDSLVLAVIRHYFWEVLRGTLEVELSDGDKTICISKDSIDGIVMSWSGLDEAARKVVQRRLEFCRKADKLKLSDPDSYFELSKPSAYGGGCRLAELFESKEHLERAIRGFREGGIVAAEFVVHVRKKKESTGSDASFLVYLQRDDSLDRPDETFIRDGLTIIGERQIREPGIRALVLAEDPAIAEFLGDAENPAHTHWLPTTKHFRGKYSPGGSLLDYVKSSALRLANLLGKVENEVLENLLDHLFGIPDDQRDVPEVKPTGKRGVKKPPKGGRKERVRYLQTSRLEAEAGFAVRKSPDATKYPDRVIIRVAYEPEAGDPFSLYHPSDFDFTSEGALPSVELQQCHFVQRLPNKLEIAIDGVDFFVKVLGFDRRRDLIIDVRPEFDSVENGGEA